MFSASGDNGRGVYGEATATGDITNYGGMFIARGDTGVGVYGYAPAYESGRISYGGYFRTASWFGIGIYAQAPLTRDARAAIFDGTVDIYGNLWKQSGNFVQPYKKDPSKEMVYAFFEGPEHAVFLRGKAKLVDGSAVIETPEHFRDVAGVDEDITVQFTPRSEDSEGLAAVEVGKDRIVVKELRKGKGTYEFDYFITAKRAGFEGHEPIQPNRHFSANDKTKEEFERRYANTTDMTVLAMRNMLIANGILTADGKLNMEVAEKLGWKIREADLALVTK